ncbi:MAG: eukaryotic-like serine/threonine-protein kinase [Pyrinomonadaceae bacterium]|jgi:serine/threonine-protein kinase|nr:eukaryotic-like serine/threonine-protein kinase [Pyrinomonadaceae bacterium]
MDIPRVIANRFRVECEIGRGGMGTVYLATHLGLERPVAVKVLKAEFAADPEVAERFMREARTMARLRHTRAAMIFDAGSLPDGRPFIVMEHVEGSTLADVLAREGRFPAERAVRIACEICDVLAEAHALGIVHRDLKPSNIMLNERGVSVLDFGIAKVLTASADVTKTHATTESGLIIGTPRYMSPEQCLGKPVGTASDLYSVGVLVYEMLSGQPPFTDQLQSAVLVRQATSAPPPLMARCPEVPRRLALATHTLLAKNPTDRPKSAREARAMLERSLQHTAQLVMPEATEPFASTIATLDTRTSNAARAVAAVAVLALLGGLFFAWSSSSTTSARVKANASPRAGGATSNVAAAATVSPAVVQTAFTREFVEDVEAPNVYPASLSNDAARQIAASVSTGGAVSEARVLRTVRGTSIAAVRDERGAGASHLFLMESRGALGGFRVAARAELDKEGFRGAKWATSVVDADGDGYDEIICTGTDSRDDPFSRRLVLYAPRTRQSYSMRVGLDSRERKAIRVRWSSNAGGDHAKPYRAALRAHALADLPQARL